MTKLVDRLIPSAACSDESVRGVGDWVSGGDREGVMGRAREEGALGAQVRPEATAGERLTDSPC